MREVQPAMCGLVFLVNIYWSNELNLLVCIFAVSRPCLIWRWHARMSVCGTGGNMQGFWVVAVDGDIGNEKSR